MFYIIMYIVILKHCFNQDALQAQMVIKKMSEMVDPKLDYQSKIINNEAAIEQQEKVSEV